MHRFFLPAEQCQAPTLVLAGREAHHGAGVLRLRRGERVTVLNGAGDELICEVEQVERSQVRLPLLASLHGGAQHPREYFAAYRAVKGRPPRSVCVWVGPEGDFTTDEVAMITASGVRPMTLGRLVLRTDTAATYCLSIINYELQ